MTLKKTYTFRHNYRNYTSKTIAQNVIDHAERRAESSSEETYNKIEALANVVNVLFQKLVDKNLLTDEDVRSIANDLDMTIISVEEETEK